MSIRVKKTAMAIIGASPHDSRLILDLPEGYFEIEVKEPKRSTAQNNLSFAWYGEIAKQLDGYSTEDVRAITKLHCGVPILRRDLPEFRETYDRVLKPLPYEAKVKAIQVLELPVTSLMRKKQKTEYLDAAARYWAEAGVQVAA